MHVMETNTNSKLAVYWRRLVDTKGDGVDYIEESGIEH